MRLIHYGAVLALIVCFCSVPFASAVDYVTEPQLQEGTVVSGLVLEDLISFSFLEEGDARPKEHIIKVTTIGGNFIRITVLGSSTKELFYLGVEENLDITDDGKSDISLLLTKLTEHEASVAIKVYEEPTVPEVTLQEPPLSAPQNEQSEQARQQEKTKAIQGQKEKTLSEISRTIIVTSSVLLLSYLLGISYLLSILTKRKKALPKKRYP